MSSEREKCIAMARILSDLPNKALDMVKYVKRAIELNPILDASERSLLMVSYKTLVSTRRQGLRHLLLQDDEVSESSDVCKHKIEQIKKDLVTELVNICNELFDLLDNTLIPKTTDPESIVFYQKLKADYYRYICEAQTDEAFENAKQKAMESYESALSVSKQNLQSFTPTSLGLILNYTVFLFEIADKKQEAINLAQETYQNCAPLIEQNTENSRAEASDIIRLLDENIKMWETSLEEPATEE